MQAMIRGAFSALRANAVVFAHRVAGFGDEFFRVLCFVRADVIDVEHRAVAFIAVVRDPRGDGRVDLADPFIRAAERAACDGNSGKRSEFHVRCIGIAALDGLPRFDLHVAFLVFPVEERHGAIARLVRDEAHPVRLLAERLPDASFLRIARDDRMDAGRIAFGDGLDGHIVLHDVFLSQPVSG